MQDSDIVVNELELLLRCYVHFLLGKVWTLLSPSNGLNSTTKMDLAVDNQKVWYAVKQKNLAKPN